MKNKNNNFKIRKEARGGYLFDNETGKVKHISDEEIKVYNQNIIITPDKLPKTFFSAPSKVYLEITRRCNLKCKICYNNSGFAINNELNTKEIMKVLNDLKKMGTFETRFTGGEPTQRKDFFKIVNYAKKLGFFVSIGTNGIWDKDLLKKISNSKIDMIIISIEGPEKINDRIRGKGSFKKAVRTISYLSKNTNKLLRINTTIAKYNISCIGYIAKLADKNGIPVINTMPIRLNGRSINMKNQILTQIDYLNFIKNIEKLRKKHKVKIQSYFDVLGKKSRWLENQTSLINKKTCAAGVEACVISPQGDVYGCAASNPNQLSKTVRQMFIAGNVKKKSIKNIWFDSKRWKIYRDLKLNKNARCLKCKFYAKKCFGNCFISSFFHSGKLNSKDPYCFVDLIKDMGVDKNG
jgi:radical SAM protein with 4Fe4S-binding SPASM domain